MGSFRFDHVDLGFGLWARVGRQFSQFRCRGYTFFVWFPFGRMRRCAFGRFVLACGGLVRVLTSVFCLGLIVFGFGLWVWVGGAG